MVVVVRVDQDYDYVQGVNYVDDFENEEQAIAFIEREKTIFHNSWSNFCNYIDGFVDAIIIPEGLQYNEWQDFKSKYPLYNPSPENFHTSLKAHLKNYRSCELEGYNPPKIEGHSVSDLHIVRIK